LITSVGTPIEMIVDSASNTQRMDPPSNDDISDSCLQRRFLKHSFLSQITQISVSSEQI